MKPKQILKLSSVRFFLRQTFHLCSKFQPSKSKSYGSIRNLKKATDFTIISKADWMRKRYPFTKGITTTNVCLSVLCDCGSKQTLVLI